LLNEIHSKLLPAFININYARNKIEYLQFFYFVLDENACTDQFQVTDIVRDGEQSFSSDICQSLSNTFCIHLLRVEGE